MKNKEGKTTANDNNKHSNMLDFWAIVLSVIALVVSCKIAENQNDINLFERRYEVYQSYLNLSFNAKSIKNQFNKIDTNDKLSLYIAINDFLIPGLMSQDLEYLQGNVTEQDFEKVKLYIMTHVNEFCVELDSAKYIFENTSAREEYIEKVEESLKSFARDGNAMQDSEICDIIDVICDIDFIDDMEEQLYIS